MCFTLFTPVEFKLRIVFASDDRALRNVSSSVSSSLFCCFTSSPMSLNLRFAVRTSVSKAFTIASFSSSCCCVTLYRLTGCGAAGDGEDAAPGCAAAGASAGAAPFRRSRSRRRNTELWSCIEKDGCDREREREEWEKRVRTWKGGKEEKGLMRGNGNKRPSVCADAN